MRRNLRWWQVICVAVFSGVYAVPILGFTLDGMLLISSFETGTTTGSTNNPRVGFLLIGLLFAVALTISIPGLALALYRDATSLADEDWAPNARLYGALGLAYPLSLIVAGFYLYRRYQRIGIGGLPIDPRARDSPVTSRWWYCIAAGPVLFLTGFGVLVLPSGITLTFVGALYLRIVGFALLTGVGIVLFSIGLAADLAQVRGSTNSWHPGTRRYLIPSLLVPGVIPLVALVYLFKRHRQIGVP